MYEALLHIHSVLRWVVLIFVLASIARGFMGWGGKQAFGKQDFVIRLVALVSCHIQFVLGMVLYWALSPSVALFLAEPGAAMADPVLRFWGLEHAVMMLVAIVLVTIGYSKGKRAATDQKRFRLQAIFFGIGLLIMVMGIAWPFGKLGIGHWF